MTAMELARKVQEMRKAQTHYFRVRGQEALEEARRFEWEVDKACKEIMEDKGATLPLGD